MSERVDLERLREAAKAGLACVSMAEMAALLAVVDEAREYVRLTRGRDVLNPCEWARLFRALEPFTPPADRAWEEVDRWNAQQANAARDLAVKAAVDAAKPNPRDRARDQLADAGVAVQRQFRSDQERIAELEARLAEEVALTNDLGAALAGWEKP